ncbi:hypothetical protein F5Y09DRAFT_353433, partial [Xylaria sp. FL1042]
GSRLGHTRPVLHPWVSAWRRLEYLAAPSLVQPSALYAMSTCHQVASSKLQLITSIGGQCGMPALSAYCASKFTESNSKEMKLDWNIKFTCIGPGGFRTEWAYKKMSFRQLEQVLPAYSYVQAEQIIEAILRAAQVGDIIKDAVAI